MSVSVELIKQLRDRTQASFADCKAVLEETNGDLEEAAKKLRIRGAAIAEKRGDRTAASGIIEAYVHSNAKIGVLLELSAETDFVSRSPDFKAVAHDIALHIAAANPKYVSADEIPQDVKDEEKRLIEEQFKGSGKTPKIIEKIVSGKIETMAKDLCLLSQAFVKDPTKTVQDVLNEAVAKFGEKITVGKFVRFST